MRVCLYHGSDLDGHCSGAIYAKAHATAPCEEGPPFEMYPVDYGKPIPWEALAGADVTLIDFSLQPWGEFVRLFQSACSVTWIDHHRSAIREWQHSELPAGCCPIAPLLDEKRAGCELAWGSFFPEEPMPRGVELLGRYDVWDHSDPDVLPFQHGMRQFDTDPVSGKDTEVWGWVLSHDEFPDGILRDGRLLLGYQAKNDAAAVSKAWFPVDFAGHRWQACNRLGKGSKFFDVVWSPDEYHGMLSFGWDGKQWIVGLYSDREDMDCGAIAKQHGGGGHPGAAGFQCSDLPFALTQNEE